MLTFNVFFFFFGLQNFCGLMVILFCVLLFVKFTFCLFLHSVDIRLLSDALKFRGYLCAVTSKLIKNMKAGLDFLVNFVNLKS